jgi:hypothetical protein
MDRTNVRVASLVCEPVPEVPAVVMADEGVIVDDALMRIAGGESAMTVVAAEGVVARVINAAGPKTAEVAPVKIMRDVGEGLRLSAVCRVG